MPIGLALAAALVVVLLVSRGPSPPADRALRLVPADALLYVHLSVNPDRAQDRELLAQLAKLPSLKPFKARLDAARPWIGNEVAYVVAPQGSAYLFAVRDRKKAPPGRVVDGFLVVGDLPVGKGARLKRRGKLPDDRALDVYASAAGTRLLPEPLGFLGGAPISAAAVPTDEGIRIEARRIGGATTDLDFAPKLLKDAPKDAFAFLAAADLTAVPEAVKPLLATLDEIALTIAPGSADPVVTLVARTRDPAAARRELANLQGAAVALLTSSGESTGQVPVFEERSLKGGVEAYAVTLAGGGELVYAVAGDRVVVSSAEEGITKALNPGQGQPGDGVLTGVPDTVQALAFFASDQLLELADKSGLDASETYLAVRPNLARIRALGAVVRRQGTDTTAELNLLLP